jgi:succinate dehydrogenase / fumarate reductase iron-sulfur subunit/fumarate reductase iron-sulfur subunit
VPAGVLPLPPVPAAATGATRQHPGPLEVTIARSDSGARRTFRLDGRRPTIVLDVLAAVQEDHDPTLAYRYSCRTATCGTCTVRVNGLPVLACQAIVDERATRLRIEPLAGMPVVRDLIVDPAPFVDRWQRVEPFAGTGRPELAVMSPASPERQFIDPALDCISCGACFSACGVAGAGRPFLGPAALNRAMTLIADSRDQHLVAHADAVFGPDGVDACHSIGACTAVCPKGLDPAGSIRRLRRWRLGRSRGTAGSASR